MPCVDSLPSRVIQFTFWDRHGITKPDSGLFQHYFGGAVHLFPRSVPPRLLAPAAATTEVLRCPPPTSEPSEQRKGIAIKLFNDSRKRVVLNLQDAPRTCLGRQQNNNRTTPRCTCHLVAQFLVSAPVASELVAPGFSCPASQSVERLATDRLGYFVGEPWHNMHGLMASEH